MALKRWHWLAGGGIVLAIACAGFWLFFKPAAPNPAKTPVEQVVKYIASTQFSQKSEPEKTEYLAQVQQAHPDMSPRMRFDNLSEPERERLRENVAPLIMGAIDKRMDDYFALPVEQRPAQLDKMIDEMQARMSPGGSDGPPRAQGERGQGDRGSGASGGSGGRRNRNFNPERMRRYLESGNPQRRAQRVQFMKDMQQRMKERGITPRFGPR